MTAAPRAYVRHPDGVGSSPEMQAFLAGCHAAMMREAVAAVRDTARDDGDALCVLRRYVPDGADTVAQHRAHFGDPPDPHAGPGEWHHVLVTTVGDVRAHPLDYWPHATPALIAQSDDGRAAVVYTRERLSAALLREAPACRRRLRAALRRVDAEGWHPGNYALIPDGGR